jgi:hypothetical protein
MLSLKTGEDLLPGPSVFVFGFWSSEIRSGSGFVFWHSWKSPFFSNHPERGQAQDDPEFRHRSIESISPDYSWPDGGFYSGANLSK